MDLQETKLKHYFALKIKLKSLYVLKESFMKTSKLCLRVFYENEDAEEVSTKNERAQLIEVPREEDYFMFKVNIRKKMYLPIICQNGYCPNFIHIICLNDFNNKVGLRLYLNDYYSFLKYFSSYKAYKIYDYNSYDEKGRIELAIDLISSKNPFGFFGQKKEHVNPMDYYTLATKVSISKLKMDIMQSKHDKDYDMHIESFPIIELLKLSDTNKPVTNHLIDLFKTLARSSYENMPIPLITSTELFDVIYLEMFPYHRQNKQKPYWVKIANDAYDLCLYNHFQCYSKNAENHIYEEIKTCSLFFYLESIFVKIATAFAKSVIINEYTKYTSFSYVDTLFSKNSNIETQKTAQLNVLNICECYIMSKHKNVKTFDDYFDYEKITGYNPLEVLKLYKNDEIYVTNSSSIIKEGLIGILIHGDDETDIEHAYKTYNCEIKAQQWLNKGIARLKVANFREWKKKVEGNMWLNKEPLSQLSFNLSTIVSYKGFKMFVIPCPCLPLVKTKLNTINGTLKYELKLLEKLIPTYELFKQDSKNSPIFIQYHSQNNFVFHNVHAMLNVSTRRDFFFFDSIKKAPSVTWKRDDFFVYKSFYSNFFNGREEINSYLEVNQNEDQHEKNNKSIDIYLQEIVKEIESLSFHVPFDSISLKTFLHCKGIRIRHLGKMLKFVTFKWLYTMIYSEILIRCIKKFVFFSMRELCLFYKKHVEMCLITKHKNNKRAQPKLPSDINSLLQNDRVSNKTYDDSSAHDESMTVSNTSFSSVSDEDFLSEEKSNNSSDSNYSNSSDTDSISVNDSEDSTFNNYGNDLSIQYGNLKQSKGHDLSSKKKALKSFLNISKILRNKLILENNLGCNFSLASKLLNFEHFKKYRNTELFRIKTKTNGKKLLDDPYILKKKYKGNITMVDMFIINVFNLVLTDHYYKEMFLATVVTNLCFKKFQIKDFNTSLDLPYNYIYRNLQDCVGISLFPCLSEYTKIKNKNRKFDIFHLKSYNCKVKRSVNLMYFDLEIYKYIHNPENIRLTIDTKNKQILSHLIFFTIIHHYHLSISNKTTVERLLMYEEDILDERKDKEKNIARKFREIEERKKIGHSIHSKTGENKKSEQILMSMGEKPKKGRSIFFNSEKCGWKSDTNKDKSQLRYSTYDKSLTRKEFLHYSGKGTNRHYNITTGDIECYNTLDIGNKYNINWIYDVKLNSLLTSKDNLTVYNATDYLTFYGLLNIIGIGIKFHFFKTALKISNYVFRYISEDNIISVHYRLMWLSMYTCKKWVSQYFLRPSNVTNKDESPYINFLYTQQSYKIGNAEETMFDHTLNELDGNQKERRLTEKEIYRKKMTSKKNYKSINSTLNLSSSDHETGSDTSSDTTEVDEFMQYYSIDPDYLENDKNNHYFFQYRKIDVYKKTYHTCSTILNNYFVYLHPLHLDFYLSLAWCNKSARNYREFLFLIRTVILLQTQMCLKNSSEEKMECVKLSDNFDSILHSTSSKNIDNDRFKIKEPVENSYFFLNDICYAHETTFLKDHIKLIPRTNSFYNIRLAYTLHYFANSLFYYYNTNKIIKMFKGKEFIVNSSFYCIKILENVKNIFLFFNAKNVNIAKVSIDLSLMILKLIFSDRLTKKENAKMMTYALSNVKTADQILRSNYGINNVDSLYCQYVLSLIYMYLTHKKCIYMFEEIVYYLLNYNYIYSDKNLVSEIFWYFPEHLVTLRCINGKGFLDADIIKCYLITIYLNSFISNRYLKKILKIILFLYAIDIFKNKTDIDNFEKNNYVFDMDFYSFEKVLRFLKGYKNILSKKDLFIGITDYEELLKNNKNIMKNEKKMTTEKLNDKNKLKEKVSNFYDHTDFVSNNSFKDLKQNDVNDLEEFWGIIRDEEHLISTNGNQKVKKYKSITANYLKKVIKYVEQKVDYLYEKAKKKNEQNKHNVFKHKAVCATIQNFKNKMIETPKTSTTKKKRLDFDDSTIDTISFFNSDESSSDSNYSDVNSISSNSSDRKRRWHIRNVNEKKNNRDNDTNYRWNETVTRASEKNKFLYKDIDIFITIIYYFLNTTTLEKVYRNR